MIPIFIFIGLAIALVIYTVNADESGALKTLRRGKPKPSVEQQKVLALQENIKSLKRDILKLKADNASLEKIKAKAFTLQKQMETLKKSEASLKGEVKRNKKWVDMQQNMLQKDKEPIAELTSKLQDKEKQLEKEFSKNVRLGKDISQAETDISSLNEKIKQLNDEKMALEKTIEKQQQRTQELSKQANTHAQTIEQMKEKEEQSDWVSKKDYYASLEQNDELRHTIEIKDRELQIKNKEIKKIDIERMRLLNQLRELQRAVVVVVEAAVADFLNNGQ